MITLPKNITLTNRSLGYLKRWQKTIDDAPDYESQIKKAKSSWGKSNKTFDEIKEKLRLMSNSTYRCSYCEDSFADEIEHIYPKDLYPDKTFIWENYLYACGPCNGPKNNQFALIENNDTLKDISRPRNLPPDYIYQKPLTLPTAFINPRTETPTDFMELDIIDTFRIIPALGISPSDEIRANYTIKVLRLNERAYLVTARKNAYDNFKSRLIAFRQQKNNGATSARLNELIEGIKSIDHQTVWFEMKRFHSFVPELRSLFNDVPEALTW